MYTEVPLQNVSFENLPGNPSWQTDLVEVDRELHVTVSNPAS
jgi:hypothetical protein